MNFLTLPCIPMTVALWSGGGFNISYLKDVEWLKTKQFYYWGDLDAHGFQILNQFRSYFKNTISVMMDEENLANFKSGNGQPASAQNIDLLTDDEIKLYNYIRLHNIRLEQEKITQLYPEKRIREIFK